MSTPRFAPTYHQGELHASDLLNQQFVIKGVFIDVNATPLTLIVLIDWNNAEPLTGAFQMCFPKAIGPWLTQNARFAGVLTVRRSFLNPKIAVGGLKTVKDRFKFLEIHRTSRKKGPRGPCELKCVLFFPHFITFVFDVDITGGNAFVKALGLLE